MKILLIKLLLGLTCITCYSQDVESIYRFKKVKKQTFRSTKISYIDTKLDSLVLYKNGDFYRQTSYSQFDNFGFAEQKGKWKLDNKILYLEIQKKNDEIEPKWSNASGKFNYKIDKRKLTPINDGGFEIYAIYILKLISH